MVRLPGVAPGLPPWRGGILLFRSQPRKLKGPGAFMLPAHAISTKNKHLLVIYSIPTRGFTAAVSVFRGTPPAKPLICKYKIRLARLGDAIFRRGHTPPVRILCSSSPNSVCRQRTSPGCRFVLIHRLSIFCRYSFLFMLFRENKKPCLHAVSRVEEILFRFVTCLHPVYPNYLRAVSRWVPWIVQG